MKSLLLILLLGVAGLASAQEAKSFYSSTNEKYIAKIEGDNLYEAECPGYGGYVIIHKGGDPRDWIDVRFGDKESDLMNDTFNACKGHFPYKENDLIEWRGAIKNERFVPYAIIYRIGTQGEEDVSKKYSQLVVIALNKGDAKVLGATSGDNADAEAKKLADTVKDK